LERTATVRLQPSAAQRRALLRTLEKANTAYDYISERPRADKPFGAFASQGFVHWDVRSRFDRTAHRVVRLCSTAADADQLDQTTRRTFRERGATACDDASSGGIRTSGALPSGARPDG
jgi:hypothetical protein